MTTTTQQRCRVLVLGDRGVGKTSMACRIIKGTSIVCEEATAETDEKGLSREITVDDEPCIVEVLDGPAALAALKMPIQLEGVIIVYSLVDRATFDSVPVHMDNISKLELKGAKFTAKALVGNKWDLEKEPGTRKVETSEGKELAEKHEYLFMEASVVNNINITEAFTAIVREVRTRVPEPVQNIQKEKEKKEKQLKKQPSRRIPCKVM